MFIVLLLLVVGGNIKEITTNDWSFSINNTFVKVQKRSGKITVSNYVNEVDITFEKISEIAENGITEVGISGPFKHRFPTFEYQHFIEYPLEYDELVIGEVENITAIRKNLSADVLVGPGARFDLQLLMFDNETITKNEESGEYFQVFNGTVKFGIQLSNWKFCGVDGVQCIKNMQQEFGKYLDFYFSIKGEHDGAPTAFEYSRAKVDPGRGRRPQTFDYGGCDVTFSQKYLLNGTWYSMVNGYPKFITSGDVNYVILRFPVFQSPIYYDPNIVMHADRYNITSSAYTNKPISFLLLSTSFSILAIQLFMVR